MEALWLKSQGMEHQAITQLVGISANTLRSYLREYQSGGIERLKEIRFHRPSSELMKHAQSLETHFRTHPPVNINSAITTIETLTGIRRSPTQVRLFLKRMGMKCLKVGLFPAKADPEVQESYRLEKLEPRIEEAKAGERAFSLSMQPISSWALFWVLCGVLSGCLCEPPVGANGLMCLPP
jgi:transposase